MEVRAEPGSSSSSSSLRNVERERSTERGSGVSLPSIQKSPKHEKEGRKEGRKKRRKKGRMSQEDGKVKPVVVFQGEPGAYSEASLFDLLGKDQFVTKGLESFEKCFQAVEQGNAQFALLPIENSLGGTIHANYDLQLRHNFVIVAEHEFRVHHCLMALPGVEKASIKKVISHPQAIAQCDGYLRDNNFKGEQAYDTAGSAKMIAQNNMTDTAAIASALAAEYYGLNILDSGIEDDDNNYTRFLLLSRRWMPLRSVSQNCWKTTMVFSLINYPGVLVKALSAFSFRDVSLTKLESRPDKLQLRGCRMILSDSAETDAIQMIPEEDRKLLAQLQDSMDAGSMGAGEATESLGGEQDSETEGDERRFRFVFYVDCAGSLLDKRMQNALRHLGEMTSFLRILGCYPSSSVLSDYVADLASVPRGSIASSAELQGSAALSPSTLPPRRLKIGIVGFGNFGQFLAKTFTKYHRVYASSRTDYSDVASSLGVNFTTSFDEMWQESGGLDCIVIAVSIHSFEAVVRKLPLDKLRGVLVVDVLSVKLLPKNVMQVLLPPEADILCTHPMFGPESGKFSWRGLPCVYEKVRVGKNDRRCEMFLDIFRKAGCRMVDMSCEIHDETAAGSQFVTHFTGRMLKELKLSSTPINTKGFETLLSVVDNTCKDSFDLFSALYKCNPKASAQLDAMKQAMSTITDQLQVADSGATGVIRLGDFVGRIQPSKTSETHARALELKRQGRDIVTSLTVGEPDFAPPKPILDALAECATVAGRTNYTSVNGMFELREAIAKDCFARKGVKYDPKSEILITHGGKQAIFCAVLGLCNPSDEVVIPAPYWVSYPEIVRLSGAKPVFINRDPRADYILSPEELEAALTPRTRMIILCNPCNPTGCAYSRDQLEALAAVLRKPQHANVMVLCDEIYERLVYDGLEHVSFAALDGMAQRTILVNGFAKGYAMTGFRLGYLACPVKEITAAALKLQSQLNSCPCSISQYAGIAALEKVPDEMLAPLYKGLNEKRDIIVAALREIPHVVCPVPQGAFYVFPDISYYLKLKATSKGGITVVTTTDFCNYLIEEHGLALPPGDAFGAPYGVRFSYAAAMEDIQKAVQRFSAALAALL